MENLKELTEAGRQLGYEGEELKNFVREQQVMQRDERTKAREAEREKIKLEYGLKEKEVRLQHELNQEEHKLAMKLIEAKSKLPRNTESKGPKTPKLPYFNEQHDDMDAYLQRFERYSETQKWDRSQWAVNLSALLKGKALDVYARLPTEDVLDYNKLKTALLIRFELTVEGFRKRFRTYKPDYGETFVQFAARLKNYLLRWIELSKTDKTFDALIDLLLRDQLLTICGGELRLFLKERVPDSVKEMTDLADQYREARGGNILNVIAKGTAKMNVSGTSTSNGDGPKQEKSKIGGEKPQQFIGNRSRIPISEKICHFCRRKGHIARDCRMRNKVAALIDTDSSSDPSPEESETKPVVSLCVTPTSTAQLHSSQCLPQCVSTSSRDATLVKSRMPITTGKVGDMIVTILRDTGCSSMVVRRKLVPDNDILDKVQTCTLADGTTLSVPLAKIEIDSPFFVGKAIAMVMDNPVYDLIIGNIDGARDPSDPDPNWSLTQAVVTRAQAKKEQRPIKPLHVPVIENATTDPNQFRKAQEDDPSLKALHQYAKDNTWKVSRAGKAVQFFYKSGLLYRQFHSPTVQNDKVFLQLVIPKCHQQTVLKHAHESILAGHMGSRKTSERALNQFYWPGLQGDVARFVRSCDICQRTTPKGKTPRIPLGTMPIIETPFERIAIDLVGPIHPPTDKGNRYILTMMDYATRYPEAVALKKIDTEVVAEALIDMFSRVGVPSEILTDLGTQFTSELMSEISRLLSFTRLNTTPYHPICNGMVEKFNGTLKQMLRRMCAERPKDWDRYLSSVLFAYREAPQDSLRFSPFELLYGRSVRGPMTILKELWTKELEDPNIRTTYQYILDLRQKLEDTCKWAHENLKKSATRYKSYYDRKTKPRKMAVGDKVLVLLPTDSNKLLMQWKGPFVITEVLKGMDYRLNVNGKTKTFHANLLKQFVERKKQVVATAIVPEVESDDDDENAYNDVDTPSYAPLGTIPTPGAHNMTEEKSVVETVHICPNLTAEQRIEVHALLSEFQDVLSDQPGLTTLITHDIQVSSDVPVRVKQYPLPFHLMPIIQKEVENMLEMGVIEPSDSPYSAPIVLVKKKDDTIRFCIDFRQLNKITMFDPEPIPSIEAIFANMSGSTYLSKFDLSKGYWQVPLSEQAKRMSAFSVPGSGQYQFRVMPFGLVNAPATFTRLMRLVLKGMTDASNYIDDTIVGNQLWKEHLQSIREFLERLRRNNLTAKPSKIYIGFNSLECFGHEVNETTQRPHPSKISAIENAPRPESKKQVRAFLGLIGFYRKFIPNFAAIAVPLTDMTRKGHPNKLQWEEAQDKAFKQLKHIICGNPILRLPNLKETFILRTDASDKGLGAVLLQEDAGVLWPVAYASRKLLPREVHYSVIEKETLAIVWGVNKFTQYLYGREFILQTDHQPIQYLMNKKATNSRIMRWALLLQSYRFSIKYISGKENVGADYLSRLY